MRRSAAFRVIAPRLLPILLVMVGRPMFAQTSAAKRDTTKAPATKAGAATTAKPSTTAKPATTSSPAAKPGATTAKPAPTTAKPATTTAKPATTSSRPTGTAARSAAPRAAVGKPTPFDEGGAAIYGGMSAASLSFSAGPMVGLALRKPMFAPALTVRLDVAGSRHTQAATVTGADAATLMHAGASAGLEATLRRGPGMRPYVGLAAGVYRFQADGPAGKAAINANDVYASTTDVAGIVTAGLRLSSRLFVEARYITVGDFTSLPIAVGVRF